MNTYPVKSKSHNHLINWMVLLRVPHGNIQSLKKMIWPWDSELFWYKHTDFELFLYFSFEADFFKDEARKLSCIISKKKILILKKTWNQDLIA